MPWFRDRLLRSSQTTIRGLSLSFHWSGLEFQRSRELFRTYGDLRYGPEWTAGAPPMT